MNQNKYLTVGALTRYLKVKFDRDINLQTVFLKGEISNFKSHSTGHLYFSIKDETSKINAIMFSTNAKNLKFTPTDGMKILVVGRVTVYEATGNYQIYVEEMLEDGVGNLYIAFEKLKEQLSKEGLFDKKYKKQIPKYPKRVGIVTAPTGAAIRDILTTIKRRYPICETILFPSLVQGENAKEDIVKKINMAQNYDIDVLIVGRGGGSIEDLWPFNEEIVARAIFASTIPVISAVGHEIDFTIADFVSDLRAPTPTAAAELAVPNMTDVLNLIGQYKIRITESINKKINYCDLYLDSIKNSFVIKNPLLIYENKEQKLDILNENINILFNHKLDILNEKISNLKNKQIFINPNKIFEPYNKELQIIIDKLTLLNPLNVLKRGYSVTYINKQIVKSITDLSEGNNIQIKLKDGIINATIKKIVEEKDEI